MGVIDAEYVLHKVIPSLGGPHMNKVSRSLHLPILSIANFCKFSSRSLVR